MSMPFLIFTCDRCDATWDSMVLWGRFSYEGLGGLLGVGRDVGWCHSCATLTAVEALPQDEEAQVFEVNIAKKMQAAKDGRDEAMRGRSWIRRVLDIAPKEPREIRALDYDISYMQEKLQALNERLSFLRHRESKERCLRCGSTGCFPLVFKIRPLGLYEAPDPPVPTEATHPGCGGRLLVQYSDYTVSTNMNHRVYYKEGRFLREE